MLEQATHLPYTFIFEDDGRLLLIPETSTRRTVDLYRCDDFPARREHHATLLTGSALADATVARHDGLHYLFGVTHNDGGGPSDMLAIFWAEALTGPWRPHATNPVQVGRASARPAGHARDERSVVAVARPQASHAQPMGPARGHRRVPHPAEARAIHLQSGSSQSSASVKQELLKRPSVLTSNYICTRLRISQQAQECYSCDGLVGRRRHQHSYPGA